MGNNPFMSHFPEVTTGAAQLMITNLASYYICYREKYLMNFYPNHFKKYCSILQIFKSFPEHDRLKKADFLKLFCGFCHIDIS